MKVVPCTASDIFRSGLIDQYAAECAIDGLPYPEPSLEHYQLLEVSGVFQPFAARSADGTMIGFICVIASTLPHYGKVVATTESYFVPEKYRNTGAGMLLLREAEQYARSKGAVGMLVSTPLGSQLNRVMATGKVGYKPSNEVFFKCLD